MSRFLPLLCLLMLAACGQKGDLHLPEQPVDVPAVVTETDEEDEGHGDRRP